MVTLIEYYKTFLIYTMKKIFLLLIVFFTCFQVSAEDRKTIRVSTDNTDLILKVAPNGRLYQSYLGSKLLNEQDIVSLPSDRKSVV